MKIAVGIIGLIIGFMVLLQSCAVTAGGGLTDNKAMGEAGSVGLLVGIACFIAGAFGFGLPLVSAIVFFLASLMSIAVSGAFPDMKVWAGVTFVLGLLALLAWRNQRRAAKADKVGPNA